MPLPDLKTYAMQKDGKTIGLCQGWSWMLPQVPADVTLVELTEDGLPDYTPPGPSGVLPQK